MNRVKGFETNNDNQFKNEVLTKKNFKAVIFDMDGVLIDSEPIHMQIEIKLLNTFGVNISKDEMSQFIGKSNQEMWTTLIHRYNLEYSISELHQITTELKSNYFRDEMLEPIVGVVDLLKDLKENNIKIAVASSSPIEHIQIILEKLEIIQYFQEIVSGDDVEYSKPEPDIFLLAAKRLGVEPRLCMVIEDSTHGIAAAKSAGMYCVGYANPNSLNQSYDMANVVVESMALNLSNINSFN